MDRKFIRSLQIDWGKIEEGSYLQEIPVLKNITSLEFQDNITIFAGENGERVLHSTKYSCPDCDWLQNRGGG